VKCPARGAGHGVGVGDHERAGPDDHHDRAEESVGAFVADEPGGDALVDDVGLLEEQLPGATVVPTMAMMTRIASDLTPPWMPGTSICRTVAP